MKKITSEKVKEIILNRNIHLLNEYTIEDKNGNLTFRQLEMEDALIVNFDFRGGLIFEGCNFSKGIEFKNVYNFIGDKTFSNCSFDSDVSFYQGEYNAKIFFNDCEFNNSASVNYFGGVFKKELRFERGRIERLNFFGGDFEQVLIGAYAHETFIKNIFINCSKINGHLSFFRALGLEFEISGTLNQESIIDVSEVVFKHFVLNGLTNLGRLRFANISFNDVFLAPASLSKVKEFLDPIILDNSPKFSTFYIQKSILDKVEFISVNFNSYLLAIRESSLLNIVVSNVTWPEKIFHFRLESKIDNKLPFIKLPLRSKDYLLIKENYRQLKYALSKQGDIVGEHYFHGLEMRAHYNYLSFRKVKNWGDKLILILSYLTSNYGQSLGRPFLSLIIGHSILFGIALLFNGFEPLSLSLENPTWEGFEKGVENFFFYINPLRKAEFSFGGYLVLIDILMRIWSSYMIYNIIRASRRFIK
jgi:uncharacterized protein YjbI with pentapeptide repeats